MLKVPSALPDPFSTRMELSACGRSAATSAAGPTFCVQSKGTAGFPIGVDPAQMNGATGGNGPRLGADVARGSGCGNAEFVRDPRLGRRGRPGNRVVTQYRASRGRG